jgi:hypothetical protein
MASDLEILFGGDASGLLATISEVKSALGSIGGAAHEAGGEAEGGFAGLVEGLKGGLEALEGLKGALEDFTRLAAAAFAVHELEEFVEAMANLGLQTEKAMKILGLSAEDVAALSIVAEESGTSIEMLDRMFGRMARGIEEGSKNAKAAVATLGLSFEQLQGMSLKEQIEAIANAFDKLPDGVLKTVAAQELFGRGGPEVLLALDKLKDGFQTWEQLARDLGIALDEGTLAAMGRTHAEATEFGKALEAVGVSIYADLVGPINGTIMALRDWTAEFAAAASQPGILRSALELLDVALKALLVALEAVVAGVIVTFNVFNLLLNGIQALATGFETLVTESIKPAAQVLADFEDGFSKLASRDFSGAMAAFGKAMNEPLIDTQKAWDKTLEGMKASWEKYIQANHDALQKFNNEFNATIGNVDRTSSATEKLDDKTKAAAEAAAELRRKWEEVLGSVKDSGSEIEQLNEKIDTLQKGIAAGLATASGELGPAAVGPKAAAGDVGFLKARAGALDVADLNERYAASLVEALKAAEAATGQTAKLSSAFRTYEEQAKIYAEHAAMPGGIEMHPAAKPGTSLHEYGGAVDLTAGAVLDWLHAHIKDFPGLEFLGGTTGARDPGHLQIKGGLEGIGAAGATTRDRTKEAGAAIDDLTDKRTKLQEKEAGGSEAEKAKIKALEEEARGAGNVLKADEEQVKLLEKQLAMYRTAEARAPIEQKLAEARIKLAEDENKAKEAGLKIDVEKAKGTGDPAKEHAAQMALDDAKIASAKARYGAESAEAKKALAEKEADENKFASETSKLTKEQLDEAIKAAKDKAEQTKKTLDDELEHGKISISAYLAAVKAANAEELADTNKLYDQEKALAGQSATERIAIENKKADAIREANDKLAEDERKAANKAESEWKSAISSIVSSFTSAIKGMVTGHETFRQSMQKMLSSLVDKFIDMCGKMLEKWITTQLAQTAVAQTQTAVRTAAEQAGSTAGMAANMASMLKSVFASAGQAFAGVFGFLSPIMGPAAAGPAAAAESTVIGTGSSLISSADIGMWRVPSDQLALVHRSELIMPAAQADSFRAMLSGGNPIGAGGGMSGVSIHPSIQMKVGAIDAGGFKQWFSSNQREIMKSMNSSVRQGAHLGLKALT